MKTKILVLSALLAVQLVGAEDSNKNIIKDSENPILQQLPRVEEQKTYVQIKKECDDKNMKSCAQLGYLYARGKLVKKDLNKALKLFTESCDGGYKYGCVNEALALRELDDPKTYKKQKELFEQTCSFETLSCLGLGAMYYNGKGVKVDKEKTKELYKKACDMGLGRGCKVYKMLVEELKTKEKNR